MCSAHQSLRTTRSVRSACLPSAFRKPRSEALQAGNRCAASLRASWNPASAKSRAGDPSGASCAARQPGFSRSALPAPQAATRHACGSGAEPGRQSRPAACGIHAMPLRRNCVATRPCGALCRASPAIRRLGRSMHPCCDPIRLCFRENAPRLARCHQSRRGGPRLGCRSGYRCWQRGACDPPARQSGATRRRQDKSRPTRPGTPPPRSPQL